MPKTDMAKQTVASWSVSVEERANVAQEKALKKLFADKNGDGKVTLLERVQYAVEKAANKDKIDRDGDGKISFAEELRWNVETKNVTTGEVNRFLTTDTNGDGVLSDAEKKAYADRAGQRASKKPVA